MKTDNPDLKSKVCESILRSLPLWFGLEYAIVNYIKDVKTMDTWVAYDGDSPIGFISIHKHFEYSAEIHVMGIRSEYHRKGIGHTLLKSGFTPLEEFKTLWDEFNPCLFLVKAA